MDTKRADERRWRTLVPALLLLFAASAQAQDVSYEPDDTGWALFVDNDALSLGTSDHDYTGGFALTLTGRRAERWWLSLDPVVGVLDGVAGASPDKASRWHAMQLAVLAFTPADLDAPDVSLGDRPYASIVYLSNSRITVDSPDSAYQSSFALGVLCLDAAKWSQRATHEMLDVDEPQGWDHQISEGGEPTARYSLARLHLSSARGASGHTQLQLKRSVALSAGYITEVNAAWTLRWGALHTPWWSFVPERAEYMNEPAPVLDPSPANGRELYAWAGIKARARLYNALLQGQFRDSEYTVDFDDMRPLIGEAWLGVTWEAGANYRLSWTVRYQTSELRIEPGDRELFWGGVSVSRSF
jgi:hypothetical protein